MGNEDYSGRPPDVALTQGQGGAPGVPRGTRPPLQIPGPSPSGPPAQVVALPPHIYAPAQAVDFNRAFSGTGLNAGNTPTAPAALSFGIPPNNVAVIRSVTLNINNMLATTDVVWRIRVDQSPVEGWAPLTIFPRASASVSRSFLADETFIFFPDGGTIDVEIEVRDGATYHIGASYHGWFFNRQLWAKYRDAGA